MNSDYQCQAGKGVKAKKKKAILLNGRLTWPTPVPISRDLI